MPGAILVLDVGRTNAKLSLLGGGGQVLASRARANVPAAWRGREVLDVAGVETWLEVALRDLAKLADVQAIVPVAHGAAAAFIANGELLAPPLSYEDQAPDEIAEEYAQLRGAFVQTGSPRLPAGLNLGAQLYWLERAAPDLWLDSVQIVPLPQYWAWRLSGVIASEVTSFGCHSDVWRPFDRDFSTLAYQRGWSTHFAPLRRAGDTLGALKRSWAERTGLSSSCRVLCGAHDSTAAFHGARAVTELNERDVTVLSTGTWFVAMRAPAVGAMPAANTLDEARDVLVTVDVDAAPTVSARFMGGREAELLRNDAPALSADALTKAAQDIVASGVMVLPTFAPGVGPFPRACGRWIGATPYGAMRNVVVALYLALVADASLNLIGTRDAVLIEGRFAEDASFVRMLATLRPQCAIYTTDSADCLLLGAARLAHPASAPRVTVGRAAPFPFDVSEYAKRWRREASRTP